MMKPRHSLAATLIVLAALAGAAPVFAGPVGFAVNSRGDFEQDERIDALWRVDLATGEAEYVGATGVDFLSIDGLAMNAESRLYGADDATKTLLRISSGSGLATPVGNSKHNMRLAIAPPLDFGITFTCTGELLVSASATGNLYRADPGSGELELIGDLGEPIVDMATIGDRIYGIGRGSDAEGRQIAPDLYLIDPETPAATRIGMLGDAVAPYNQAGLAADEDGNLWAITNRRNLSGQVHLFLPGEIHRIDPDSGRAEKVAETIVGFESLAIAPPSECGGGRGEPPEPDEPPAIPAFSPAGLVILVLLMAGLAAVGTSRSRIP